MTPSPALFGRLIYQCFFEPDFIPLYDHPQNRTKARRSLCQVSTLDKHQDPETQLRQLRDHARHWGFAIIREFVDYPNCRPFARGRAPLLQCARRGRYPMSNLIKRYGADFAGPDLRERLSADCERHDAAEYERSDLYFPGMLEPRFNVTPGGSRLPSSTAARTAPDNGIYELRERIGTIT